MCHRKQQTEIMIKNRLLILALLAFLAFGAQAQEKSKNGEEEKKEKTFDEIITDEAISDEGLFSVYEVDDKFYYEIPDSLLSKEMLMVTRISKTVNGLGFGGGKQNTQVVRWVKNRNQIILRIASYQNVAADSLPVYEAVANSNYEPIIATFPIAAKGKDSLQPSSLIEVTDLFTKDVETLGISNRYKKSFI